MDQAPQRRQGRRGRWVSASKLVLLVLLAFVSVVGSVVLAWGPLAALPIQWIAAALPQAAPPLPGISAPPTGDGLWQVPANSPQGCVNGVAPVVKQSYPLIGVPGRPGIVGEVALTFDDGPSPLYTAKILATLQAAGARATFFVIGRHAQRYPDLVRAEWRAGNAIGNHTYDHNYLFGLRPDQVRANLAATSAAIRTATGDPCIWLFRPPYGDIPWQSADTAEIRREGFVIINWDDMARDWQMPPAQVIAQRVIAHLHAGAIILLHDSGPDTQGQNRSQTVAALPLILAAMHQRGLRAVTLPTLLRDAGVARPAPVPAPPRPTAPTGPWRAPEGFVALTPSLQWTRQTSGRRRPGQRGRMRGLAPDVARARQRSAEGMSGRSRYRPVRGSFSRSDTRSSWVTGRGSAR